MKIDTMLNQIYEKKWFNSDIYNNLKDELTKDSFYVDKKGYSIQISDNQKSEIEIGNFYISTKLLTNKTVTDIMNFLQVRSSKGGAYSIFNEFNPSLPIVWDCEKKCYFVREGFETHPCAGITWQGALFIAFLVGGRLPFELEWEVCATAGDLHKKYPWGNDNPSPHLANYGEYTGSTTPVGKYPPNEWGLYDTAGNVAEWCMDWYHPAHPYTAHLPVPDVDTHFEKTVKGGSWNKGEDLLLCRSKRGKWYRIGTVGIGVRILWEPLKEREVISWLKILNVKNPEPTSKAHIASITM